MRHESPESPSAARTALDLSDLDDRELVARVLGGREGGRRGAEELLRRVGLAGLREAPVEELARYPGLGVRRAERLVASVELGRRAYGVVADAPRFDGPESVARHAAELADELREHFIVWLLNARHRLVGKELVSIGSLSASIVHPREVFRPAIAHAAAAVILAHNHPSGDPEPSRDDIEITRRLVRAGHLVGIPVLDHVIVAGRRFVSLRRDGLVLFEWREMEARAER